MLKGMSALDNILNTLVPILRYALPIFALVVTLVCVISLLETDLEFTKWRSLLIRITIQL